MDSDKPETNNAAPISDASRKRRRRTYAWRGAGIGAFVGILIEGSMILYVVKSPNGVEGEGIGAVLLLLGTPVLLILAEVIKLLTVVLDTMGAPGQWAEKVMGQLTMLLSIPLNFGLFGFVIGWLVGNSRNSSTKKMNGVLRPWDLDR